MKPLLLNTLDTQSGAAIATYRIHRGLRSIGVDSHLLVQCKEVDDDSVIGALANWRAAFAVLRPYLDGVVKKRYPNRKKIFFSPAWLPENLISEVDKVKPDIVHLFWVTNGFLRIETLKKFKGPIIWTLHDMWPFTGGCHYDDECGRFRQSCGNCPILNSGREHDLSRSVWTRKQKSWDGVPLTVVATSHWLADMARSSSLFANRRIEVIPNGLDTEVYKPVDKSAARAAYNLPQGKHLLLFSAFSATSDRRKGGQYLMQALEHMSKSEWKNKVELVIIGASRPDNAPDMGMNVHYMGHLHDEISQVLLYSAADVVVAPSMQENLSNTVMESLACATPVVAFDIGGMPDMIDHRANGYLARPFDPADLSDGIMWVLENDERHDALARSARQTVLERYTLTKIAEQYQSLYRDMLS